MRMHWRFFITCDSALGQRLGHRLAFFHQAPYQQLGWGTFTGIARDAVHRPRSLVPEFAGLVGLLRFVIELGCHRAFQHIGHDRTRMPVAGRCLARGIAHREHHGFVARGIGGELLLEDPDLIGLFAMGPGQRQWGEQAERQQGRGEMDRSHGASPVGICLQVKPGVTKGKRPIRGNRGRPIGRPPVALK
ncbi:hypothetical protein EMIT047CA2_170077 [Pseudomonas soli]